MTKNLILLGMMGVGKSTIGKIIAQRTKMKFFDTDNLIEKKHQMKIKDIFKKRGEIFFRSEEKKTTLKCLKYKNSIIALGGGAILDKLVRNILIEEKKNISFWLSLDIKKLATRLENTFNKRPLLKKNNNFQILEKIYKERKNLYKLSNFKIACDNLNKNDIAKKIITIFYEQ